MIAAHNLGPEPVEADVEVGEDVTGATDLLGGDDLVRGRRAIEAAAGRVRLPVAAAAPVESRPSQAVLPDRSSRGVS